jgi:membrane-bound lytic murein transglycosylase D
MMNRLLLAVPVLVLTTIFSTDTLAESLPSRHFPVDSFMRKRVNFWKKIYTDVESSEALIHDSNDMTIVYERVKVGRASNRSRRRKVKRHLYRVRGALRSIAKKGGDNLTAFEKKIYEIAGEPSSSEAREMSRSIRYQYGMRDRYYRGLVRSQLYMKQILEVFEEMDLPKELAFLPHVESSFNYKAYSKVGAAGIWQFMRGTGRLYGLKMNYVIDERRDPMKATRAAARLLRDNYRRLKAWPLALTAYNHGPASIARAVERVGTRDISKIIQKYDGRRFGFASKNFYATFVAASEISLEPERYFSKFKAPTLPPRSTIKLDRPYTIRHIQKVTGLSKRTLKEFNLALRPIAFRNPLYLPKGFQIHVPRVDVAKLDGYRDRLAALKTAPDSLKAGGEHIISRGESLYWIARTYRTSVADLIMLNQISSPSRIYPGMKLKIPSKADQKKLRQLAKTKTQEKKRKERGLIASRQRTSLPTVNAGDTGVTGFTTPGGVPEDMGSVAPGMGPKLGFFASLAEGVESFFSSSRPSSGRVSAATAEEEDTPDPETVKEREVADVVAKDLSGYSFDLEPIRENLYLLTVESDETLGHFADWGQVKTQRIRDWNGLGFGESIRPGQTLRIRLSEEQRVKFNAERTQYHAAIEEDFYQSYKLVGTETYVVRRGDTLSRIMSRQGVPFWLMRKVQTNGELKETVSLRVGQRIKIPQVKAREDEL